ncbi:hydroxymethylbilane synthase [bacterium]|nr:MAG: hydroxymethylbilane synthase [bacterium]RKZ17501.1 MAG: hydroxymethylbilane synthase [bacterium]
MDLVKLGTRGSPLALWQARWCRDALMQAHPGLAVEIVEVESTGDLDLKTPLVQMGEVGIFTKTLERQLELGAIDLAVHSLKDVPAQIMDGTSIVAVSEREDPRDVIFLREAASFAELPEGATVATGSLRRRAQLRAARPDLKMVALRGNLNTRWRKFEEGQFDAMLLAAAGVIRLGWQDRVSEYMPVELLLPAVGQGIVGIQALDGGQAAALAAAIDHTPTHARAQAERSLLATVAGGCIVPLAGFAELGGDRLHLRARLADPEKGPVLEAEVEGPTAEALGIGREVGEQLLAQGGAEIITRAKSVGGN